MKNFLLVTDFKWQANLMRFYTEQRKTSYEQRDLYELSNSTGRNLESGLHTAKNKINKINYNNKKIPWLDYQPLFGKCARSESGENRA